MLKKLDVSRSGYYDYINRKPSKTKERREQIKEKVKTIHKNSYEIYGSPKITKILQNNGENVSQKYIHSIMKECGIKAKYIKPWTKTTISHDFSSQLENLLNRHFNPSKPDCAWCTDITYIWTYDDGFVYLTSVMDLFSRKIISWVLTKTMAADDVLKCIEIAKERRKVNNPLVIQSDRGVQYTSDLYYKLTKGMIPSYSHKGNPWDNACIESFHSLIKREWLDDIKISDYKHAYRLIFEYIEGFYNTVRIHSHCNYESPVQYEKQYWANNS